MPEEIEGASAVVDPSHEPTADTSSLLDSMVDSMAEKSVTADSLPSAKETAPAESDDLDPTKETATPAAKEAAKEEPAVEDDELGIKGLIKKKPAATPEKATDKPAGEKPATAVKSPTDELKIPKGIAPPKWFRGIYDTTKAEAEKYKAEAEQLRKEKEDLAKRPASPELESKWKADLENERKGREAAEENLRIVGYEKSPEFERDHLKPLESAWKSTLEELVDQEIEVSGMPKKTSVEDVQAVVAIDNKIQAGRKARELFGDDAPAVLAARENIRNLTAKRDEALETWRTKGTEHQQQKAAEQQELLGNATRTFSERVATYSKQYPDIWEPKTDEEKSGKAAADKLIDMAFKGEGLPKFDKESDRWQFHAKLKADIAARAQATPILIIRNNSLTEKVAELEAKLKAYDRSEPTVGNKGEGEGRKAPKRESANGSLESLLSSIDAMPGQ